MAGDRAPMTGQARTSNRVAAPRSISSKVAPSTELEPVGSTDR